MSRYTDANDRPMEAIEAGREAEEDRLNASRATDTRSRFEAWADGHGLWYERGPAPYTNTEDRNGKYLDPVTETAWECWQAARSSGEPGERAKQLESAIQGVIAWIAQSCPMPGTVIDEARRRLTVALTPSPTKVAGHE